MSKNSLLNMGIGAVFVWVLCAAVATGTMAGMERDDNIYGTPAQHLWGWLVLGALVIGIGWAVFGLLRMRRHSTA